MKPFAPHVPDTCVSPPKSPLLFAFFLLAGFCVSPFLYLASAQAPAFNPKYPLQFYEMARRQGYTDASCATTAKNVTQGIDRYGPTLKRKHRAFTGS